MAADGSQQPDDFPYIQLWASADGETHIKEFKAKGFDLKKYASVRLLRFTSWLAIALGACFTVIALHLVGRSLGRGTSKKPGRSVPSPYPPVSRCLLLTASQSLGWT